MVAFMKMADLWEFIGTKTLIFDGAMGTQIQSANLTAAAFDLSRFDFDSFGQRTGASIPTPSLTPEQVEGCNDALNLTSPEVIEKIHKSYFEAGSDLVTTNTFGASSIVLAEYGIADLVYPICYEGARIARRAAESEFSNPKQRFVVGGLGPGTKLLSLSQTDWSTIESTYKEGFLGLLRGGCDALLLETLQDLLMIKAAVIAAIDAMAEFGSKVPLFVSVTMEQTGTMLLGSDLAAALTMLEMFPEVSAIGINCATGPTEMAPHVRFLSQNSTRPILVQPNAGLPVMEKGAAVYKLTPVELAEAHTKFVSDYGACLIGGCCGTTPAHIEMVTKAVEQLASSANCHWQNCKTLFPSLDFRNLGPDQDGAYKLIGLSSLYQHQPYLQDNSLLYIGERTNANGSKAFRDMLSAENWDGLTELAQEVEAEGSHVLDVCTAYVGRNEVKDMETLLVKLNKSMTIPIMIDSTEPPVIERALQCVAGKPVINSINFEDGGKRAHQVLSFAKRYGAAVVALTIDEKGMAKTVEDKVAIANRLLALTRDYGLAEHDVFIDCLTFTLGSGDEEFRNSGFHTLEAIREVKRQHPTVNTILGVSNISFGLKPAIRQVLNSAMLHYAVEYGLTSAIVHVSKIAPENKIPAKAWQLASDLIFDRRKYSDDGKVA